MTRRLLSASIMLAFAWIIIWPTVASATRSADHIILFSYNHNEGSPCPDCDEDGPCDDTCSCTCCQSHSTVMFSVSTSFVDTPDAPRTPSCEISDTLNSGDFQNRIFRPPRG